MSTWGSLHSNETQSSWHLAVYIKTYTSRDDVFVSFYPLQFSKIQSLANLVSSLPSKLYASTQHFPCTLITSQPLPFWSLPALLPHASLLRRLPSWPSVLTVSLHPLLRSLSNGLSFLNIHPSPPPPPFKPLCSSVPTYISTLVLLYSFSP